MSVEGMKHALEVPLNYLAYRPTKGRFNLLTIWGFSEATGGDRHPNVVFSIIDTVTGEETASYGPISKFQAERRHHTLIRLIRVLNEQRQGDADALWAEFRTGRASCVNGHLWLGNAVWNRHAGGTYVCRSCRRNRDEQRLSRVGGA